YDVNKTLTPQLIADENTSLILIDLGCGKNRMGGSSLDLINNSFSPDIPDVNDPTLIKSFFKGIQSLNKQNKILAYHDRSDGGLIVAALEMAFAGHCGLKLKLTQTDSILESLFNEELGAIIQIANDDLTDIQNYLHKKLGLSIEIIGYPTKDHTIRIFNGTDEIFTDTRGSLQQSWAETSYKIQSLRDNPKTAKEEYDLILDDLNPGIQPQINFDIPKINISKLKPKIAILREQGINGHNEMAAAFNYAGFEAYDVHMSDISSGVKSLKDFQALAACGGFSFGDVLGAGEGWAKSILFNQKIRDEFEVFFTRNDTIALGVCNGCQMMSNIKEIIPGTELWPHFVKNESEQFEARFVSVEIKKNNSLFFNGMIGSTLPVVVAHGEGRAEFSSDNQLKQIESSNLITMQYAKNHSNGALMYPMNPNGSPLGITGITNADGRVTIMMPHPERVFRTDQNSWHPKSWNEFGPWYRMFTNTKKYFN
ncbi:MAG: phosphoribosylformylglycinamidine synthase subunit PurQ, partial [Methylophilaceae bacterium]